MLELENAKGVLATLSDKQRDVLELVIQHKSSKEIARALGISPFTVDQRIAAAKSKLGGASRGDLARHYLHLKTICGESVYEFSHVDFRDVRPDDCVREQPVDPVFTLSDVSSFELGLPWRGKPVSLSALEALDNRFGPLGRVFAILALAALTALMFLAMVAIAETLKAMV